MPAFSPRTGSFDPFNPCQLSKQDLSKNKDSDVRICYRDQVTEGSLN